MWRELEDLGALSGLAGYQVEAEVNWRGTDRSVSINPLLVTANFFDVTGVPVAMGRGFTAAEAAAERQPQVVVISHRFWQSRLGADPAAVGRTLVFNGQPYTVLGVLPPSLRAVPGFGLSPEVYLPLSAGLMPEIDNRRAAAVELIGRLRDDQPLEQGRLALDAAAARLDAANASKEFGTVAKFARAEGLGYSFREIGIFFMVLSVAVALVLGIACANVAGLLLSRATVRRREVAVRAALGASRGRLIQQLLAEAFWIALAGTVSGLLLSYLLATLLSRVQLPVPLPFELHVSVNLRMLLLALAVLAFTTVVCGLMPALHATRRSLVPDLKQDEPRFGRRRWSLRSVLVVGQLAVSVVLLLTAFLFLRNLARAQDLDPGVRHRADLRRAGQLRRRTPHAGAASGFARGRGRTPARQTRDRGRLVFARRAAHDAQRHDDRRGVAAHR